MSTTRTPPAHTPLQRVGLGFAGCVGAGAVYALDIVLRPEVSVTNVYLLPIAAVGWVAGAEAALAVAAAATLLSWSANAEVGMLGGLIVPAMLHGATALTVAMLGRVHARERHLARTDTVTGAENRRAFEERVEAVLGAQRRAGRPVTAVAIDLDGFKLVNDTLGHDAGDEVLRAVADTLRRRVRSTDVVARLGGDEFAVLLVNTDATIAASLLPRLHGALDEAMARAGFPVTFSIGALTFEAPPRDARELLQLIDAQMYTAKRAGKDKLVHAVHAEAASLG